MMIPVNQFFETLEEKHCEVCGEVLNEQADCYVCTCDKCDPFQAHTAFRIVNHTLQS